MKRNQSNNLPVAEIIECTVMGQQTIMEIEGRLKFARIGDKLYKQPFQAAQTVEPVAWQWLDTGTFRKTLPKTAVVADWNPLFKNFPTIAQPEQTVKDFVKWLETQIGDNEPDKYTLASRAYKAGKATQPEQTPVRQPLTHTEIVRAWDASMAGWIDAKQNPYTHFARAIEAKHGITTPESKK